MPHHVAPQICQLPLGASRIAGVDFGGALSAGVLLSTTVPLVVTVSPTTTVPLEYDREAVTTVARRINNRTVPAKEAVTMLLSGGKAGERYEITITAAGEESGVANDETYIAVILLDVQ